VDVDVDVNVDLVVVAVVLVDDYGRISPVNIDTTRSRSSRGSRSAA
jgi:hypothetical protein